MVEITSVLLFYEFTYKAYGQRKRNTENPYTLTGRAKALFNYDKNGSISEQLAEFKKKTVEDIKTRLRDSALFHFELYGFPDTIEVETVVLFNVREGTIWSTIEDI